MKGLDAKMKKDNMLQNNTHESRIGSLEGQFSALAEQFSAFMTGQQRRDEIIFQKIDALAASSQPSTANQVMIYTLILGMIVAIGSPIAFFINKESNRMEGAIAALDVKLQHEAALTNQRTDEQIKNLDAMSISRREESMRDVLMLQKSIDRIQDWQDAQAKSDLMELRDRRMKNP